MRRIAFGLILVALAGCTQTPDRPVVADPGDVGGGAKGPQSVLQQPDAGLANVRPTTIDAVSFDGDRSKLRVTYWSGIDECYGLARVEQRWNADALTLTVLTGNRPLPKDTACIDIAVSHATIITLQQDLGNRQVVDGTTREAVRWR